jgi:Uma2 family endonuclease
MERRSEQIEEFASAVGQRIGAAEYEALPPSRRLELVDGVPHVLTPPTSRHQRVLARLEAIVAALCPRELEVVREQEIRLSELHRRNPDLMVVRAEAFRLDGNSYPPDEVVLAVEVVSPTTAIVDRKHKPAEYADAAVGHYWRIETTPELALHTYRLSGGGQYVPTGVFRPGDITAVPGVPWAKISIDDLAP